MESIHNHTLTQTQSSHMLIVFIYKLRLFFFFIVWLSRGDKTLLFYISFCSSFCPFNDRTVHRSVTRMYVCYEWIYSIECTVKPSNSLTTPRLISQKILSSFAFWLCTCLALHTQHRQKWSFLGSWMRSVTIKWSVESVTL